MPVAYDEAIKKPQKELEYTREQIQELAKCYDDLHHFFKYVKIVHPDYGRVTFEPYDFQRDIVNTYLQNRFMILLLARQVGKSTVVGVIALWYAIFNKDKLIGITSYVEKEAIGVLDKIKIIYEELPEWLKPGVKEYNKKSIVFDNGSIIRVSATTKNAFRGKALNCVTGETKICVCDDNENIFYTTMERVNLYNEDDTLEKKYQIKYQTKNLKNGKTYMGFYSTNDVNDGHIGGGKYIKKDIEKYGIENFQRKIITIFEDRD